MIYDASSWDVPQSFSADLVVIGSGAGGSMAAMAAAEAGLKVYVLEAGAFVPPSRMTQREEEMLPQLLWDNGGRMTKDKATRIHQGRGVGGSTLHNINLCKRIPGPVLAQWRRERGLAHLPEDRWNTLYDEVEDLLTVSEVPPSRWSRHNQILKQGCEALGWRGGGLAHNRSGCLGSGFCLLGCAYDAKNNALKVPIPRAIDAGASVLANCQAITIDHAGGTVQGVNAVALHPITRKVLGAVRIDAPRVCVSASATGTAAILQRSRIPDPGGETGERLRIHPALVAAGVFRDPVRAWQGIPQTYECTQFLDFEAAHSGGPPPPNTRNWIVTAFAHPVGTATMMPGLGADHTDTMSNYAHMAVLTSMLHDNTAGVVRPSGDLGLSIDYWPDEADCEELVRGLVASVELLLAAGAEKAVVPTDPVRIFRRGDDLSELRKLKLTRGLLDVTAVHPMGSVPMGDDPTVAAVGSNGRHHHVDGLWVADGSLFPSSIGVPPQLSIYAMGLHVGRSLVAHG
jgi:choline dehydrogenase-like flavoprotein